MKGTNDAVEGIDNGDPMFDGEDPLAAAKGFFNVFILTALLAAGIILAYLQS